MSSPYVVLGERPLDQWKVTELKKELKKRRLTIGGLKEDLVKRLDEAVRLELEEVSKENADNCLSSTTPSELPSEQELIESVVELEETSKDKADNGLNSANQSVLPSEQEVKDSVAELEETSKKIADIGLASGTQSELPSDKKITESVVSERAEDLVDAGMDIDKVGSKTKMEVDDHREVLVNDSVSEENLVQKNEAVGLVKEQAAQFDGVESTVLLSETVESVTVLSETHIPRDRTEIAESTLGLKNDMLSLQDASKIDPPDPNVELPHINEDSKTQSKAADSTIQIDGDSSCLQSDQDSELLKYQVSKVNSDLGFQVASDSISTESVTIIEKNELKVDVIADNVKLELDIKHEVLQSSRSSVATDGESHPMDVEEPFEQKDVEVPLDKKDVEMALDKKDVEEPFDLKVSIDETCGSDPENVGDLELPEKLNLDRSYGDDSMEEGLLDLKQVDFKSNSSEIIGDVGKPQILVAKEENDVDIVSHDKPQVKVDNAENKTVHMPTSTKRKFDKEAIVNNDTAKKPRRWNVEGLKGSEPQVGKVMVSTTPKESSQPTFKNLSRSNSLVNEAPKERVVPPSSKPPTNSLRIDRFLRPFTLKAVRELVGKTGTDDQFWMDNIKTHCYVSYDSVEEAIEIRNAVYNLQWPPNGGRLLVAEFVDPQEAKACFEVPLASPSTPSVNTASSFSAQKQPVPSPRVQDLRQQLTPQTSFPPPPPLANPPMVRERLLPRDRVNLPPPSPSAEKVETPIVTLDDLFKKTKAIPRIYYLPLSEEQVAAKVKSQGNVNQ